MSIFPGNYSAKNLNRVILIICAISFFILLYILNVLYPLVCEDWMYSFVFSTDPEESQKRISNLIDIFVSQYNQYIFWTGRSVVHAIDQFLLLLGEEIHNILNAIAYILFVYLIYKIANYKNEIKVFLFIFLFLFLFLFLPDFTTNVLWLTYSSVYLWGTLLCLLFIFPYYKFYQNPQIKQSNLKSAILFFSGIIAGWTYEAISVSMICFVVFLIILIKKEIRFIPKWMIWGGIGAILGCSLLILAPGNFNRIQISPEAFIPDLLSRLSIIVKNYFKCILLPTILYILLLINFIKRSKLQNKNQIIRISALFVIWGYLAYIAMFASPLFPTRTLFGSVALLTIGLSILLANTKYESSFKYAYTFFTAILLVFSVWQYIYFYEKTSYIGSVWKNREIYLKQQKSMGVEDIVFKDNIEPIKGFIIYELNESAQHWPNMDYAKYYQVKTVRIE